SGSSSCQLLGRI
ncbi:pectate disaccharide-lyase domain protein, partial [Vibrio parahaemolyticus V-223/04]